MPEFHIVNVVWGKLFTETYIDVVLPLQLCKGNLDAFQGHKASYRIFTTAEDRTTITQSPIYKHLKETILVDFIEISKKPGVSDIEYMNFWHQQAILDAARANAALVFLSPDCLVSNRMFPNIIKEVEQGKRVLMIPSIRLKKEKIADMIIALLQNERVRQTGLSSRELVSLSLPFLHGIAETLFWGEMISSHPSHIYWFLDEKNILIRAFHLHPLLVWPENTEIKTEVSIDDDFILSCPDRNKWKIIQDSDEMILFEISNKSRENGMMNKMQCTPKNISLWAKLLAKSHHCEFAKINLYIKSSDRISTWESTEKFANKVMSRILLLKRVPSFRFRYNTPSIRKIIIYILKKTKTYNFAKSLLRS